MDKIFNHNMLSLCVATPSESGNGRIERSWLTPPISCQPVATNHPSFLLYIVFLIIASKYKRIRYYDFFKWPRKGIRGFATK